MEDYLITFKVSFVDTETGEIFANSSFSKPLSILGIDPSNYNRYYDSFFRGVRQGKKVALSIDCVVDRQLPIVAQTEFF